MSNLFNQSESLWSAPLAYALRPVTINEFFGQEEIVGEGKLLRQLIEEDNLHSVPMLPKQLVACFHLPQKQSDLQ